MASRREVYHVVHAKNADIWRVRKEGSVRVVTRAATKVEAVTIARNLVKRADLTLVIVHRADGSIETEWTYVNDPDETPA